MTELEKIITYEENWYALVIAIVKRLPASKALRLMGIGQGDRKGGNNARIEMQEL
jgi:hypothetical protein